MQNCKKLEVDTNVWKYSKVMFKIQIDDGECVVLDDE